jgi:hypothetical protein
MPENTFDIVSKIDLQEVSNAIQQALKEIHTRFDLKDSKSAIIIEGKDAIILASIDEFKLKAVNEVLQQKLVKSAGFDSGRPGASEQQGSGYAAGNHCHAAATGFRYRYAVHQLPQQLKISHGGNRGTMQKAKLFLTWSLPDRR